MKIGIVANTTKPLFWKYLPELLDWFAGQSAEVIISEDIAHSEQFPNGLKIESMPEHELPNHCEMLLAMGGDGTILRTIATIGKKETPILGVNLGGLGFLTEITIEKFTDEMSDILKGHYRIEERLMLHAQIDGIDEPLYALNEIVLDKGGSVREIEIEVHIDGLNRLFAFFRRSHRCADDGRAGHQSDLPALADKPPGHHPRTIENRCGCPHGIRTLYHFAGRPKNISLPLQNAYCHSAGGTQCPVGQAFAQQLLPVIAQQIKLGERFSR